MINQIKSILGIVYPVVVIALVVMGLIWLSTYIGGFAAIALGVSLVFLAKYL